MAAAVGAQHSGWGWWVEVRPGIGVASPCAEHGLCPLCATPAPAPAQPTCACVPAVMAPHPPLPALPCPAAAPAAAACTAGPGEAEAVQGAALHHADDGCHQEHGRGLVSTQPSHSQPATASQLQLASRGGMQPVLPLTTTAASVSPPARLPACLPASPTLSSPLPAACLPACLPACSPPAGTPPAALASPTSPTSLACPPGTWWLTSTRARLPRSAW